MTSMFPHDPFRDTLPNFFDDNWPARHYHLVPNYHRRMSQQMTDMARQMDQGVHVINDGQKFAVEMDVAQYRPDEIDVKVENDQVIVSAKHEEVYDNEHGFVKRSFTRRYSLPTDVDDKQLACNLSERGVLTLEAPRLHPQLMDSSNMRAIPIMHVPAHEHDKKENH